MLATYKGSVLPVNLPPHSFCLVGSVAMSSFQQYVQVKVVA